MTTRRAIILLLALLSVALLVRLVHYEGRLLAYPFPWELRESLSLHHAMVLAQGEPLYRIRESPPLVVPAYGPVYPAVVAPLLKIWPRSFFAPRLVSFASLVVLLACTGLAVHALTREWIWSLIAVGLVLLKASWWRWLLLCRPDALGSCLLLLALYVHWKRPRSGPGLILTVVLLALAFFTKVYLVLGAASVLSSYAFVHRDRRRAWQFLLTMIAVLSLTFGALMVWTGGLYFVLTFEIMSHWTTYSPARMALLGAKFLASYAPILIAIAYAARRRSLDVPRYGVFWTHLVVGTPLTALLLLNDGSAAHYWFLVLPAAVILGCHRLCREAADPASRAALPFLALTALWMVVAPGYSEILPSPALADHWTPLRERVVGTRGAIMNDDVTAILNIESGRELYSEGVGFAGNAQWLSRRHGFRFVDVEDMLRRHHYAVLLNPEYAEAARRYYDLRGFYEVPVQFGQPGRVDLYEPRGAAPFPEKAIGLPRSPGDPAAHAATGSYRPVPSLRMDGHVRGAARVRRDSGL